MYIEDKLACCKTIIFTNSPVCYKPSKATKRKNIIHIKAFIQTVL